MTRVRGMSRVKGLLLPGAAVRVRMAAIATAVLWLAVLWASLSQPVPPKPYEPPPPAPPALRSVAAAGQPTPIGGSFDRFDVTAQPIMAPLNASGQIAFYASILRNPAREAIFLATGGRMAKLAAIGDRVPDGGVLSEFAKHPLPALNDAGAVAFVAAIVSARAGS